MATSSEKTGPQGHTVTLNGLRNPPNVGGTSAHTKLGLMASTRRDSRLTRTKHSWVLLKSNGDKIMETHSGAWAWVSQKSHRK